MVSQEKEALLTLGSSLVFAALAYPVQKMIPRFECEFIFTALVVFIAVLWIGRRIFGISMKTLDERDIAIRYRSGILAAHGFGIVMMIGMVVLWSLHRSTLVVPVTHVVLLAYFGYLFMYVSLSVAVLGFYRRGV